MFGVATRVDGMPLRLQDRVVQQEPREYVQRFATSARVYSGLPELRHQLAPGYHVALSRTYRALGEARS
jgi:hypothetical protein